MLPLRSDEESIFNDGRMALEPQGSQQQLSQPYSPNFQTSYVAGTANQQTQLGYGGEYASYESTAYQPAVGNAQTRERSLTSEQLLADQQSSENESASPWHHHHYMSPSTFASQQPDRYICPTCSKPFSRPSSLRIHSHSHTGEKPFKCPHCIKRFSVRSNMKRHSRSCNEGEI